MCAMHNSKPPSSNRCTQTSRNHHTMNVPSSMATVTPRWIRSTVSCLNRSCTYFSWASFSVTGGRAQAQAERRRFLICSTNSSGDTVPSDSAILSESTTLLTLSAQRAAHASVVIVSRRRSANSCRWGQLDLRPENNPLRSWSFFGWHHLGTRLSVHVPVPSCAESRYGAVADVVAAGNVGEGFAVRPPCARFPLLVRGELKFPPHLHAPSFRSLAPLACPGADKLSLELRQPGQDGKH